MIREPRESYLRGRGPLQRVNPPLPLRSRIVRRKKTRRPTKRADRLLNIIHAAARRARSTRPRGARSEYDLDEPDNLKKLQVRFATGRCELTGLPFNMKATKKRAWNSPSIDRIDAKRGYTYDNVRFILWGLNASLSDWGERVFELIATAWLYKRGQDRCTDCS